MSIFNSFFEIILEALFPSSKIDGKLFSYSKEHAQEILPCAPPSPITSAQSIFAYKNELVKSLVWNIKYKKSEKALEIGGYALYLNILKIIDEQKFANQADFDSRFDGKILIVPIPISHRRRNERGYNQCELLLNKIIEFDNEYNKFNLIKESTTKFSIEIEKEKLIIPCNDLLQRVIHKDRQTLKDRSHRLEDAKNIFEINQGSLRQLRGELKNLSVGFEITVIVIDDVITTGSTIKEAMGTLRQAGFENVRGLSLAH